MATRSLRPVRWTPPPPPYTGRTADGPLPFLPVRHIPLGAHGPEDVISGQDGALYTGVEDGRVLRVEPGSGAVTAVGSTGGRTLGLAAAADGTLICCDTRGLLRLDPRTGMVTLLATEVDGARLVFCSNAIEAADGSIYFTESTARFDITHYRGDFLEHRSTGRLMVWHPDGTTATLLHGLDFANGVDITSDGTGLLFAETGSYRLSRYHLSGPRAGTVDRVVENLAGFPDNIGVDAAGLCWIAMATPRNRLLDRLSPRAPWLRRAINRIPPALQPQPERTAWVIAVDDSGRVVHDLRSAACGYHFVTGVVRVGAHLYLASLEEDTLLELELPD